jgi:hypothetical protein
MTHFPAPGFEVAGGVAGAVGAAGGTCSASRHQPASAATQSARSFRQGTRV